MLIYRLKKSIRYTHARSHHYQARSCSETLLLWILLHSGTNWQLQNIKLDLWAAAQQSCGLGTRCKTTSLDHLQHFNWHWRVADPSYGNITGSKKQSFLSPQWSRRTTFVVGPLNIICDDFHITVTTEVRTTNCHIPLNVQLDIDWLHWSVGPYISGNDHWSWMQKFGCVNENRLLYINNLMVFVFNI